MTPRRPQSDLRPDAYIIGGGADIDPGLYDPDMEGRVPANPERDAFEIEVLAEAARRGRPVLGICRGMQLMNVMAGGSLFQDLAPVRHHTTSRHLRPKKIVHLTPNSKLAHMAQENTLFVNSLHHQGVNRLGHGFVVCGRDRDHIIQAIEHSGPRFRLGLQWHPEYLPWSSAQRRIFAALVQAAVA